MHKVFTYSGRRGSKQENGNENYKDKTENIGKDIVLGDKKKTQILIAIAYLANFARKYAILYLFLKVNNLMIRYSSNKPVSNACIEELDTTIFLIVYFVYLIDQIHYT